MDLVTVFAAAAEAAHEEHDPGAFYLVGGILAAFGVIVGAIGVVRPSLGGAFSTLTMALGAILAAAAMVTILAVS